MPCEELVGRDVDERAMFYDAGWGVKTRILLLRKVYDLGWWTACGVMICHNS